MTNCGIKDKERRRLERAAPKMQSLLSPGMVKGNIFTLIQLCQPGMYKAR